MPVRMDMKLLLKSLRKKFLKPPLILENANLGNDPVLSKQHNQHILPKIKFLQNKPDYKFHQPYLPALFLGGLQIQTSEHQLNDLN